MTIDTQHPVDIGRDLAFKLGDGAGQLVEFGRPQFIDDRRPLGKQHFGLEYKAVARYPDIRALRQNSA